MLKRLGAGLLFFQIYHAHGISLTWEETLRYTQAGNPQVESSKNEWLATQSQEAATISGFLPRLSATASYTQTGSNAQSPGVVNNGVVIDNRGNIAKNYSVGLNFTQNIFNGLSDSSRYDQAKWRSRSSYWGYVNTKASLSYQLKEAFADLVYAQDSLELSQSILERRRNNLKLVQVRYDNGRENKGSVLLADAYFEQAQLDLLRARDNLRVAQTKLKSLMNQDHIDVLKVEGNPPLESLEFENKTLEDLILETPVYNQAVATENVAKEELIIGRSNFLPTLDLNANVNRQGESFLPEQERERWSVGLSLTIPLFDGLRDRNTYKASVFSKYAAEGKKKSAMLELLPKLREAQNLAKQSDIKLRVDSKFREATSTRAEIARAKYNNGLITFEDWDIIENELIQRQTTYILSKKDRVVKYAAWENILGKGSL